MRVAKQITCCTLIWVAGCADPSIPIGLNCGEGGLCPMGQVCEQLSQTCRLSGTERQVLPIGIPGALPDPSKTPLLKIAANAPAPEKNGYVLTAGVGSLRFTWAGYSEFRGSIYARGQFPGNIQMGCSDNACMAEPGITKMQIDVNRTRLDFVSFPTGRNRGGITFLFPGGSNFTFDLAVDSEYHPELVTLVEELADGTSHVTSAPGMPFALSN